MILNLDKLKREESKNNVIQLHQNRVETAPKQGRNAEKFVRTQSQLVKMQNT